VRRSQEICALLQPENVHLELVHESVPTLFVERDPAVAHIEEEGLGPLLELPNLLQLVFLEESEEPLRKGLQIEDIVRSILRMLLGEVRRRR
jgi:hypothetical protein